MSLLSAEMDWEKGGHSSDTLPMNFHGLSLFLSFSSKILLSSFSPEIKCGVFFQFTNLPYLTGYNYHLPRNRQEVYLREGKHTKNDIGTRDI